ncbi:hypothetical protein ACU686_10485 [Yinghuangia aomiensis]
MPRSITVSAGGYMTNFLRDRAEVLKKADDVWRGVREGWLAPHVHADPSLGGSGGSAPAAGEPRHHPEGIWCWPSAARTGMSVELTTNWLQVEVRTSSDVLARVRGVRRPLGAGPRSSRRPGAPRRAVVVLGNLDHRGCGTGRGVRAFCGFRRARTSSPPRSCAVPGRASATDLLRGRRAGDPPDPGGRRRRDRMACADRRRLVDEIPRRGQRQARQRTRRRFLHGHPAPVRLRLRVLRSAVDRRGEAAVHVPGLHLSAPPHRRQGRPAPAAARPGRRPRPLPRQPGPPDRRRGPHGPVRPAGRRGVPVHPHRPARPRTGVRPTACGRPPQRTPERNRRRDHHRGLRGRRPRRLAASAFTRRDVLGFDVELEGPSGPA